MSRKTEILSRRRILATVGSFGVVTTAGCTEVSDLDSDENTRAETDDQPPTDEADPDGDDRVEEGVEDQTESPVDDPALPCATVEPRAFDAPPYYDGPLYDSHFHIPPPWEVDVLERPVLGEDVTLDDFICLFDREDVQRAVSFFVIRLHEPEQTVPFLERAANRFPDRFVKFLLPAGPPEKSVDADLLEQFLDDYQRELDIRGFGEIAAPRAAEVPPDSEAMLDVYEVASDRDLIVMIHPNEWQREAMEIALDEAPAVTFLLHGHQSAPWIGELIESYDNVYYSYEPSVPQLFQTESVSEMQNWLEEDFDAMLEERLETWQDRIEAHPERFLWGSDRAEPHHYEKEAGLLIEEFDRAFIGRLSSQAQTSFAYQNSHKLID